MIEAGTGEEEGKKFKRRIDRKKGLVAILLCACAGIQ
jgi:hypothetical protein